MDFNNLGFKYRDTDKRYVSYYKDNKWDEGKLIDDPMITMNECACVLQYSQTCFEGLKAYRTKNGDIALFRPELNARRFIDSCKGLYMPTIEEDKFVDAVTKVALANERFIPPYETGGSLYIRPFMFGSDPIIGVEPANEYQFRVFSMPVGNYFQGGIKNLNLRVSDVDRAAPHGTGNIKAGLNYAMSLRNIMEAHAAGFDENVYLDPKEHKYVEETGGANLIFITKDNQLVTPMSDSILPSVTRRSLLIVAREYLGLDVIERKIDINEVKDMKECGLCGTAAVISPVGTIDNHGEVIKFNVGEDTIIRKLLYTLRGIQLGEIEDKVGFVKIIKEVN